MVGSVGIDGRRHGRKVAGAELVVQVEVRGGGGAAGAGGDRVRVHERSVTGSRLRWSKRLSMIH